MFAQALLEFRYQKSKKVRNEGICIESNSSNLAGKIKGCKIFKKTGLQLRESTQRLPRIAVYYVDNSISAETLEKYAKAQNELDSSNHFTPKFKFGKRDEPS